MSRSTHDTTRRFPEGESMGAIFTGVIVGPRWEAEGVLVGVTGRVAGFSLVRRGGVTLRAAPVVDNGGREAESDPTAGKAFIPSDDGGVRDGMAALNAGYKLFTLAAGATEVATASALPHGRRASRGADVARDELDGEGWNPAMRALALPGEALNNAGLGELCAVSAMIAFKSTLQSSTILDTEVSRINEQQNHTLTP